VDLIEDLWIGRRRLFKDEVVTGNRDRCDVFVVMRPGSGHDATAGLHGASILGVMSAGADTETFVVRGSGPINGTVHVPGAKNSVLKLMATTLLTDGTFELTNVPDIVDVTIMGELLSALGVNMRRPSPGQLLLTNTGQITPFAPYELVKKIRASINVLGPLLTRCGEVRLSMPGGDDFGARPIDMHIDGLKAMGAEFRFSDGYLEARCERLHGADITFDDRQLCSRARNHRPLQLPLSDGRRCVRDWYFDAYYRGCRA
jgi:hypothetical protein